MSLLYVKFGHWLCVWCEILASLRLGQWRSCIRTKPGCVEKAVWAWFRVYSLGKLVHSCVSGVSTKRVEIVRADSRLGELTRKLDLELCNESLGMELVGKVLGSLPTKPCASCMPGASPWGFEDGWVWFWPGKGPSKRRSTHHYEEDFVFYPSCYIRLLE